MHAVRITWGTGWACAGKVLVVKGMPQKNGDGDVEILNGGGTKWGAGRNSTTVTRTRRTTSFWMLWEFWDHDSLKYTSAGVKD